MEASGLGALHGGDRDLNAAFAGVAATNALAQTKLQPNLLGEAQSAAIAQFAGSLALAAASLTSGSMQGGSLVAEMPNANAGHLPLPPDLLRTLPSLEKRASTELPARRGTTELLPPARLVEVAHAALQSAGFRRRQPSAQQSAQQDSQQPRLEQPNGSGSEGLPTCGALKRERQAEDGVDHLADQKRPRTTDSSAGNGNQDDAALPTSGFSGADGIARINPAGASNVIPQQAVPPTATSAQPAASPTVISPFARPLPTRFSGTAADVTVPAANDASGPVAPGLSGPLKSAFQNAALSTDWQPGCSVMTGRRSARSPAPKGSRHLSIPRATSMDANSSPMSRRGSGFGVAAGVPPEEASSGNGGGAAAATSAVAAGPGAAAAGGAGAEPASSTAPAAAAAPETAASADLRRLAQLAEAAAMLEEQHAGGGGAGKPAPRPSGLVAGVALGSQQGSGRAPAVAEDSGKATASTAGPAVGPDAAADAPGVIALRQRAGSLTAAGLQPAGPSVSASGASASAVGAPGATGRDLGPPPSHLVTAASGPGALRSLGSMPLPSRVADSQTGNGAGAARGMGRAGVREDSPGEDGGDGGRSPRRGAPDSEAISGGASRDNNGQFGGEDDGDLDDDMGDGSHDSGGGGSSGGGSGNRTLTERYRAALKASAAQRGRGSGSTGSRDGGDRQRGGTNMRNGVCARIASITKERLQQVYHLNIEEAARELGIGMTKLKEHCRTLGIPRWPSRKLKSMDKLIESLNERAMTEPATKEVIADILAEIEQFKRAIYENPCLEVEEDIKRLRQSNFKKEYQQRQVEQRLRLGTNPERQTMTGLAVASRASSLGGPLSLAHGVTQLTGASALSAAAAASMAAAAAAGQTGLPGGLGSALAAGLPPGLMGGAAAGAASSAQLVQALQMQAPQLPGQMPLLAPGLQQLLMAQQTSSLGDPLQQLMAQRAALGLGVSCLPPGTLPGGLPGGLAGGLPGSLTGGLPGGLPGAPGLLLPPMLTQQLLPQQLQQALAPQPQTQGGKPQVAASSGDGGATAE